MTIMDYQLLHAAAVGINGKGVILVGKGGSGKSSAALSCLDSALSYSADDYCLLSFRPEPTINSLFATGKINFEDINRFDFLLPSLQNMEGCKTRNEKSLFFLHDRYDEKILREFTLSAIFVVEISESSQTRINPTTPTEAFKAIAPSTLSQIEGSNNKSVQNLSALVKQVPSFTLSVGSDFRKTPEAIIKFLEQAP